MDQVNSLEALMDKTDNELREILTDNSQVRDEEITRLIKAMRCLKLCQNANIRGTMEKANLYWDSWDRPSSQLKPGTSPRTERSKASNKNNRHLNNPLAMNNHNQNIHHHHHHHHHQQQQYVEQVQSPIELSPPENVPAIPQVNTNVNAMSSPDEVSFHTLTPSPSPPNSPASCKTRTKGFPTTPPPRKKHQTLVPANSSLGTLSSQVNNNTTSVTAPTNMNGGQTPYDQNLLTKSRSHEFQLLKQQQEQQQQQQQQQQNHDNVHQQLINSNSSHHHISGSNGGGGSGIGNHTPNSANGLQQSNSPFSSNNTNHYQYHLHQHHMSAIITTSSESSINTTNVTTTHAIPTPRSRLHTEPGQC